MAPLRSEASVDTSSPINTVSVPSAEGGVPTRDKVVDSSSEGGAMLATFTPPSNLDALTNALQPSTAVISGSAAGAILFVSLILAAFVLCQRQKTRQWPFHPKTPRNTQFKAKQGEHEQAPLSLPPPVDATGQFLVAETDFDATPALPFPDGVRRFVTPPATLILESSGAKYGPKRTIKRKKKVVVVVPPSPATQLARSKHRKRDPMALFSCNPAGPALYSSGVMLPYTTHLESKYVLHPLQYQHRAAAIQTGYSPARTAPRHFHQ